MTSNADVHRRNRPVTDFLSAAREARRRLRPITQETVDELTAAVHRLVRDRSKTAPKWAETAVSETGYGDIDDKITKIRVVVDAMYEDMAGERSVGVLDDAATDPVEIGKPVGVVGAHTPSTNSASTPVALALTALKGGNALVISPSPFAVETCNAVVDDIQDALEEAGFPPRLVQSLSDPIRKDRTEGLLERADAIQVTGSPSQVERGETCGTPNYCVGAGNTVGIVDPTADAAAAAERIAHSAAFDNGLVCVCLSNLLVPPASADEIATELAAAGGYVCSESETDRLRATLFDDDGIDPDCIGRPAATIASMAGFGDDLEGESFLVPSFDAVDLDDPLVRENLSPVVTLYRIPPADATAVANAITSQQGRGHSCAVYGDRERAIEIAKRVDVCRVSVNQSSIELAVGDRNRIDTSLSLGCGTWGGNQTDENITYEQFTNTTTLCDRVDTDGSPRASALERTDHGESLTILGRILSRVRSSV